MTLETITQDAACDFDYSLLTIFVHQICDFEL